MLTLVIMLSSFMEGLCQVTSGQNIAKVKKECAINKSRSLRFVHHETIRIKENLDAQASSPRVYYISISQTCATLTSSVITVIH